MRQPGAFHHARFMGKSLYVLKTFMLSSQFPMSRFEKAGIRRIAQFVALLYGRYFLSASLSVDAPRLDLTFYYDLCEFRRYDQVAANQALTSVRRHLWYLTPELVILSLFDDNIPDIEKIVMAQTLRQIPKPHVFAPGKPGQPAFNPVAAKLTDLPPPFADFITSRSWLFFHLVNADTQWLYDEPSTWHNNPQYRHLRDFCKDMQVVNDAAERGVKDVTDFAKMSRDPAQRDAMIVVANDHRGRVTNLRKGNLNNL